MGRITLIIAEPQEMVDNILSKLREALTSDPFSSALVLPRNVACQQLKDRLIADGMVLLGHPICTLDEMASDLFEKSKIAETKIDTQRAELLIREAMEENRSDLSSFEPIWAGITPTVTELRALFETWRRFRVDLRRLHGDDTMSQARMLLEKYQQKLQSNNLVDEMGAKEMVIRHLREKVSSAPKHLYMLGLNELCPLDRELIGALAESAQDTIFIIRRDGGKAFNEDLSWLGAQPTEESSMRQAEEQLCANAAVELRTQSFHNRLAEARTVASEVRALIDAGEEPAEICVLLPKREHSAELYREALDDCGVWCNLEVPTDLLRSPIVHALLDMLDAVVEDMPREHVVRLLGSPFFRFRYASGEEKRTLNGGYVGKLANEAGIGGGRDEWREKLGNLQHNLLLESSSPEVPEDKSRRMREKAERIEDISRGLQEWFELLRTMDGSMSAEHRVETMKVILKEHSTLFHLAYEDHRVYSREAMALSAFLGTLDNLVQMERFSPGRKESLRSFASRVRLLCSSLREELEPKYDDAVRVTGLRSALMARHDHVFIVGMVEKDIPDLGAGNPFITEEAVMDFGLLDKKDMLRQERVFFYSALLSARKSLHLSSHSSSDGEKVISSSFFDEIVRLRRPQGFHSTQMSASRAEQQKAWGEAASGRREWDGVVHAGAADAEELLRRINVEAYHRVQEYDSPYDGILSDVRILADLDKLVGPRHVFSPTELDIFASCPQRFYLERILKIEPRPQLEVEIGSKDQGTFVHQVAFRLFSEARERGMMRVTPRNLEEMERLAQDIAEEELANFHFTGPAYEAFRARMAGSQHRQGLLQAFLEFEAANTNAFDPSYFELSFGRKLPPSCDPHSRTEPVLIQLAPGEELLLAGRVDRVDQRRDGHFIVVDYKTGELPSPKDIRGAKSLQVQLYMQAIQSMFPGSKAMGGVFYRVKSESEIDYATIVLDKTDYDDLKNIIGRKTLLPSCDEFVAQTNHEILKMLRRMRGGRFHPTTDEKQCKSYCEYRQVCRFDALRAMDLGGE